MSALSDLIAVVGHSDYQDYLEVVRKVEEALPELRRLLDADRQCNEAHELLGRMTTRLDEVVAENIRLRDQVGALENELEFWRLSFMGE